MQSSTKKTQKIIASRAREQRNLGPEWHSQTIPKRNPPRDRKNTKWKKKRQRDQDTSTHHEGQTQNHYSINYYYYRVLSSKTCESIPSHFLCLIKSPTSQKLHYLRKWFNLGFLIFFSTPSKISPLIRCLKVSIFHLTKLFLKVLFSLK